MEDQSAFFTENKEIASQIGAYKFQKQPRRENWKKKEKENKGHCDSWESKEK